MYSGSFGLGVSSFGLLASAIVFVGILAFFFLRMKKSSSSFAKVIRHPSERYFQDPKSDTRKEFPSIQDPASVSLSVIVPAYNESKRMKPMLDECISYLDEKSGNKGFTYEVIVVDDGSRDDTSKIALEYSSRLSVDRFRVLTLAANRGKGGAIRLGVLSSRGARILFADADGATKFADYAKLDLALNRLGRDECIAVGSRAHLETQALAERSFFRNCLMYGFKMFVRFVGVKGIKDTQCGFKLFTRSAAEKCFTNLHVERWAFDVELLCIAEKFGIPVCEIAVNWTEMDGSKLIPVFSWIQMALDIFRMRMYYTFSLWKTNFDVDQRKSE